MQTQTLPEKKIIKTYIKKNGEVVIKEYNQQEYNLRHYEKHKEKYTDKHECDCGGNYTLPNKAKHYESRIHKLYQKYIIHTIAQMDII